MKYLLTIFVVLFCAGTAFAFTGGTFNLTMNNTSTNTYVWSEVGTMTVGGDTSQTMSPGTFVSPPGESVWSFPVEDDGGFAISFTISSGSLTLGDSVARLSDTLTFGDGGDTNVPATYTNFIFWAVNNYSTPATAKFYWDGALVKTEDLQPLHSTFWLSPNVELTPVPQDWTANVTLTVDQVTLQETNGQSFFGNGGPGGSSSTSATGTGAGPPTVTNGGGLGGGGSGTTLTGGTNTIFLNSGTNTDVFVVKTNTVVWQPPSTGLATESTLEGVGSLLHGDLNNILAGESILHGDLNTANNNLVMLTNELGQLVTFEIHRTNNDDLGQLIPIFTNLVNALSNRPPDTVTSFPTNISLSISNFATETTQQGISNLLATSSDDTNDSDSGLYTNPVYFVTASDTNSDAAIAAAQSDLAPVLSSAQSASNIVSAIISQDVPDGTEPNMMIDMSALTLGHATILFDANPVHNFPWVFVFLHAAFTWLIIFVFVKGVISTIYKALQAYASAQTSQVPNMTGGAGSGGQGTAPVIEA